MSIVEECHSDVVDDRVDDECLRVSRSIFTDPDVYGLEIKRIFNRNWLFLAHDSELPKKGSYVTRPMGDDNVIITRGDDGAVRGFLNSCQHRGAQLCRADSGTARRFVCPYHSWTYDTTGALRSTSYDQHHDRAAFANLGLTPIPRLETYCGLIFGNWDPDAISLDEHLGDTKWYLQMLFGRTPKGMSVLGPPQRWIIETNWKIPGLNFIDAQHAGRVHYGAISIGRDAGAPPIDAIVKMADTTPQVSFPQGHGVVMGFISPNLPEFFGFPQELIPLYKECLDPIQVMQLGKAADPQVGTLFPNTSWVHPLLGVAADEPPKVFLSWRNWQPRGVNKVEVWNWTFADTEASPEMRQAIYKSAIQCFGIGGIYEEDDAEVWSSLTRAISGSNASKGYMDFSAGKSMSPLEGFKNPGTAYPSTLTEHAQRGFLRRWKQQMGQIRS